jgi:ABC-type ATPase with predicted acetyltransferase domain
VRISIDHEVPAYGSYAAERTRGLYNVGVEDGQHFHLDVELPDLDGDWQIGVVVGPSGSGKTSILRYLVDEGWREWSTSGRWRDDGPIIEVLTQVSEKAEGKGYDAACASLAAVGLGSVPSWLRPRAVLSMGEGFRADMARLLLDTTADYVVVDEFTSVLDRQVAQVGAGAFAKAWRKQGDRKIVVFTPHYDILDWVQPDWVIDTHGGERLPGEERKVVSARKGDFQAATDHAGYPGDRVATLEC